MTKPYKPTMANKFYFTNIDSPVQDGSGVYNTYDNRVINFRDTDLRYPS